MYDFWMIVMKEYQHGGIPHSESNNMELLLFTAEHTWMWQEAIMVYKSRDDTKYGCFPQMPHESVPGKN